VLVASLKQVQQALTPKLRRIARPATFPRVFKHLLKHKVVFAVGVLDFVPELLGSLQGKVHELEKNVDIFLEDIDVVAAFSHGGIDPTKYRASSALQLAEKMLDSHWVCVVWVVVEVVAPASFPDLSESEVTAGQIKDM
jgi:hypothetical protein